MPERDPPLPHVGLTDILEEHDITGLHRIDVLFDAFTDTVIEEGDGRAEHV